MHETSLRQHQKEFVYNHIAKNRVCLYWDCRTGKSLAAQKWLDSDYGGRNKNTIAVVLKKNKNEWQERLPNSRVFTKEEIKEVPLDELKNITGILIDECHFVAGSLFIQRTRSQLSERIYRILEQNPNTDLILLSATPVTNNYASLHTLMTFMDIAPPWKQYLKFMTDLKPNPFLKGKPGRNLMYFPKKDWRVRARKIMQKYSLQFHRVTLKECARYLPPEIIEIEEVKGAGLCECEECHWTHDHKLEQKNKIQWVLDRNFDKAIIVCHYRVQVKEVAHALAKHRKGYTVFGGSKDHEQIIKKWQKDPFGYLVISAAMGEGFDGYTADAMIFMSIAHKVSAHIQMKERLTTLDADKMKPKLYYYLLGGTWDWKIYQTVVKAQKDFHGEDS